MIYATRRAVLVVTLGLLAWLLAACGGPSMTAPTRASFDATADPDYLAPDFTAVSLDGTRYTLSELRGTWVVLNFWATWCAPCVQEMPALQAIADRYADTVLLLGLNVAEDEALVRDFVAEHGLRFPILLDAGDATRIDYQVVGLPQTLIIAPNGEIMWRRFGPVDAVEFAALLDAFIAGAAPPG